MSWTILNAPPFFLTFFFVNSRTFGSSSRPLGWARVMSIPKKLAPMMADWGTASGFSTDPEYAQLMTNFFPRRSPSFSCMTMTSARAWHGWYMSSSMLITGTRDQRANSRTMRSPLPYSQPVFFP